MFEFGVANFCVTMHKKKPLNDDFQNIEFESNSLQTFH
jgi:hypothetical protein